MHDQDATGLRPIGQVSLLVFGQEGPGLSEPVRVAAELVCSITQFGSTRSINAGVASGIAMHTWIRQHADLSAVTRPAGPPGGGGGGAAGSRESAG